MKKNIANLIMVVIILALAAAGFFAVGSIQGWFGGDGESAVLAETRGIVNMERDGLIYPVENETTVLAMGLALRQDYISYSPVIRMNPVTPLSFAFYAGYVVLCLMPLGLDLWTEYRFRKARKQL